MIPSIQRSTLNRRTFTQSLAALAASATAPSLLAQASSTFPDRPIVRHPKCWGSPWC
jgi:hypothetical protein